MTLLGHRSRRTVSSPPAPAPPTRDALSRALVVPPAIHLHCGIGEEVVAEMSAGHHASVDGKRSYTVRSIVARLFVNRPDVDGRLIRLGCLFYDANRPRFLGDRFSGAALTPNDRRSPATAKSDRAAYEAIVNFSNYCAAFRLDTACTCWVVEQALHVAERGTHHLVLAVQSAVKTDCQTHSDSAKQGSQNTTMKMRADYIQRNCASAADRMDAGQALLVSRGEVVDFLEAEATRRLTPARRERPSTGRAASADARAGDRAEAGGAGGDESSDSGSFYSRDAPASDSDGRAPRRRRRTTTNGGASSPAPGEGRCGGGGAARRCA